MKITAFDPVIATGDPDSLRGVFEALGFEKTHAPVIETENAHVSVVRMKHENGYHVEVVQDGGDVSRDRMLIRMNVDDFQEAYRLLIAHGFRNTRGDETVDSETARAAVMVSPSGFQILLNQHLRK